MPDFGGRAIPGISFRVGSSHSDLSQIKGDLQGIKDILRQVGDEAKRTQDSINAVGKARPAATKASTDPAYEAAVAQRRAAQREETIRRANDPCGLLQTLDHRGQGQVHRALLPDFDLVEVADRAPVLHPAGPGDRPGAHEECFYQSCLACPGMADQRDVPHAAGLAGHCCPAGGWGSFPVRHESRLLLRCSFGCLTTSLYLPATG